MKRNGRKKFFFVKNAKFWNIDRILLTNKQNVGDISQIFTD